MTKIENEDGFLFCYGTEPNPLMDFPWMDLPLSEYEEKALEDEEKALGDYIQDETR